MVVLLYQEIHKDLSTFVWGKYQKTVPNMLYTFFDTSLWMDCLLLPCLELRLSCCCCCRAPIGQGYGLTETSAGAAFSESDDPSVGRVGPPVPCCYIKV